MLLVPYLLGNDVETHSCINKPFFCLLRIPLVHERQTSFSEFRALLSLFFLQFLFLIIKYVFSGCLTFFSY